MWSRRFALVETMFSGKSFEEEEKNKEWNVNTGCEKGENLVMENGAYADLGEVGVWGAS
jgi:hypothetical protein